MWYIDLTMTRRSGKSCVKSLLVIDMQNDFMNGALGTSEAAAIVDNVAAVIGKYPVPELARLPQDDELDTTLVGLCTGICKPLFTFRPICCILALSTQKPMIKKELFT